MNFIKNILQNKNNNESITKRTEKAIKIEKPYLKNLIFQDDFKQIYASDLHNFINYIEIYSGQRPVSEVHILNLLECLKLGHDFKGTFKLIHCLKENEVYIIDGQHRFYAFREMMALDPNFNRNVIIELYSTDESTSENTIQLFKDANNCKNIETTEIPVFDALQIVDELSKQFPDMIRFGDSKRVNRPRISKQELTTKIRQLIQSTGKNKDEILRIILEANEKFDLSEESKKKKKITRNMIENCKGFHLGLDDDFQWLRDIIHKEK